MHLVITFQNFIYLIISRTNINCLSRVCGNKILGHSSNSVEIILNLNIGARKPTYDRNIRLHVLNSLKDHPTNCLKIVNTKTTLMQSR